MYNDCKVCDNSFEPDETELNGDKLCEECVGNNDICDICRRILDKNHMFSNDYRFSSEYNKDIGDGQDKLGDGDYPDYQCCYKCAHMFNDDHAILNKVCKRIDNLRAFL